MRNKTKETGCYCSWRGMINRCNNPNDPRYHDYGGAGITICDEWLKFGNFHRDMGDRPPGMSIDRKNNSLGYCKDNCKWSTRKEQQRNRRNSHWHTVNGVTKTIAEWAEIVGISDESFTKRIRNQWPDDRILCKRNTTGRVSRKQRLAASAKKLIGAPTLLDSQPAA